MLLLLLEEAAPGTEPEGRWESGIRMGLCRRALERAFFEGFDLAILLVYTPMIRTEIKIRKKKTSYIVSETFYQTYQIPRKKKDGVCNISENRFKIKPYLLPRTPFIPLSTPSLHPQP